jgi:hypothetical protein
MAKLSMAQRRALPKSDFAVPSKAPGPGSYPIPDAGHAKAAKSMAGRFGSPAVKSAVKKKAASKGFASKSAAPAAKAPVDKQLQSAIRKGRAPMYKQISDQLAGGY